MIQIQNLDQNRVLLESAVGGNTGELVLTRPDLTQNQNPDCDDDV